MSKIAFDAGIQLTVNSDLTISQEGIYGKDTGAISFDSETNTVTITNLGVFRVSFAASGLTFDDLPIVFTGDPTNVRLTLFNEDACQIVVIITDNSDEHSVGFSIDTSEGQIDPSIAIEPPDNDPEKPKA